MFPPRPPLELEMARAAVREHYIYGRPVPKDMCFAELAEEWYKLRKKPFISNATGSTYKNCFVKHLLSEFGLQKMRAIDANQLQDYVNTLAGTSKSQVSNIVGTLKHLFAYAYAQGMIERDPTVALIRPKITKASLRRPLTKKETEGGADGYRDASGGRVPLSRETWVTDTEETWVTVF